MKKRYGIGFLIGMIVFTLVLVCAYQLSYDRAMRKLEAKQKSIQKKQENVIETKGSAQKEEGYFIKEKDGYIIVYLSDEKTVYEYTTIEIQYLPERIQEEVKKREKGRYYRRSLRILRKLFQLKYFTALE
ncbi:MAG: hypothetical protein ACLTN0_00805 [Coprococcus phoceensis]